MPAGDLIFKKLILEEQIYLDVPELEKAGCSGRWPHRHTAELFKLLMNYTCVKFKQPGEAFRRYWEKDGWGKDDTGLMISVSRKY